MTTQVPSKWPEDMTEMMRKHWELGLSASQSAKIINETFGTLQTRNSIIGKRHRMGLKREVELRLFNNPPYARGDAATRLRRAARLAKMKPSEESAAEIERLKEAARSEIEMQKLRPVELLSVHTRDAVMGLRRNSCRFPVGVLGAPDFHFCCKPKDSGSSYCAEHRALCTVVVPVRRIR
jgi:GcrA cell cycle regulator